MKAQISFLISMDDESISNIMSDMGMTHFTSNDVKKMLEEVSVEVWESLSAEKIKRKIEIIE